MRIVDSELTGRIGNYSYDWDTILGGEAVEMVAGLDFPRVKQFRSYVYTMAARRGLKVRTKTDGNRLYIQAEVAGA